MLNTDRQQNYIYSNINKNVICLLQHMRISTHHIELYQNFGFWILNDVEELDSN